MSSTTSRSTVLVVDDEPELVDLFSTWLDEHYDVQTTTSGVDAVDRLDDTVDVVTLDRQMPDRSGDEILAEIRSRNVACSVVVVSGVDPDDDALEASADEYLVKPVSRAELRGAVGAVIGSR